MACASNTYENVFDSNRDCYQNRNKYLANILCFGKEIQQAPWQAHLSPPVEVCKSGREIVFWFKIGNSWWHEGRVLSLAPTHGWICGVLDYWDCEMIRFVGESILFRFLDIRKYSVLSMKSIQFPTLMISKWENCTIINLILTLLLSIF